MVFQRQSLKEPSWPAIFCVGQNVQPPSCYASYPGSIFRAHGSTIPLCLTIFIQCFQSALSRCRRCRHTWYIFSQGYAQSSISKNIPMAFAHKITYLTLPAFPVCSARLPSATALSSMVRYEPDAGALNIQTVSTPPPRYDVAYRLLQFRGNRYYCCSLIRPR